MADFNEGDKVKFLNRTGGGVIVKVIDPKMVTVAGDDGFEIPVLISELVRMDPTSAGGRFFEEHYKTTAKKPAEAPAEKADDRTTGLPPATTSARTTGEIWLAFVPHDQKWLMTGFIDVYLINNSSYDLLYNLFHKTSLGHYEGVDYGSVFADSRLLLATVNREDITRWSDGYLQFLFHKSQSDSVLPPFNSEFRVEGRKFFKEGNYRESTLIGARGIVIKIVSLDRYLKRDEKEEEAPPVKESPVPGEVPFIARHRTAQREAEVDLHIHELVDDPVNLEKTEILDYQKSYFLRCLDSAISAGYLKLTVIHGVGNGVLRTVILDLLKNYKGIEIIDAPMSKYGVGAIEIRIPHNRE
jgi:hypothetical protein